MNIPRLLIADSSDEFRQILFHDLSHSYCVKTCADGLQALELLRSFRPDLLVLDLSLTGLDGLSLLHRAASEGVRPMVMALSTFESEYIVASLERLGAAYFMKKPCDLQAVCDRLADFAADLQPTSLPQADINTSVANLLLAMGFRAHWDGFRFLQAGIPIYAKDPGQSMTKELYVAIGKLYNKNHKQVERSIRGAIEKAWQSGNEKLWQQFFCTADGSVPRPSNNEFFARIITAFTSQIPAAKLA